MNELSLLSTLPSLAVKSTLTIALALGAIAIARSWSAAARHLIVAALFAFLLILPAASIVLPQFAVEIPESALAAAIARPAATTVPAAAVPRETGPSIAPRSRSVGEDASTEISPVAIAVSIYGAGVVVLLASLVIGVARLRQLRETGQLSVAGTSLAMKIARESGMNAPAEVVFCPGLGVPMTFGFLRPAILLPSAVSNANEEELGDAIRHELEHVRRRDWLTQLGARLACALWWPHPLIWLAWRRLCLEAERACDDAVLRRNRSASELYAERLVAVARRMTRAGRTPALAMARRSNLGRRIHAILDPTVRRDPASRLAFGITTALAIALLFAVAPIRLVNAADSRPISAAEDDDEIDPDDQNEDPLDLALYRASENGNLDAMQRLLGAGADPNAVIEGDGNPLIGAARAGHQSAVELLLNRGADIDAGVEGDGNALITAAREGHLDIVRLLLDRGAEVDRVIPGDENALIQSSGEGRARTVRLLLERGANPNSRVWVDWSDGRRRGEWRTPLGMALRGGHHEVAQMLRAAGAVE